jgi:lysine 2,3-aminomutase
MGIRNLSMFIPDPIKYSAVFRIRLERLFAMIDQVNWNSSSWVNSTRTVLDTHHGKVRREDFKGYDTSRNVAIFQREGHTIEYPDLPESMDVPGDIDTLLWKESSSKSS